MNKRHSLYKVVLQFLLRMEMTVYEADKMSKVCLGPADRALRAFLFSGSTKLKF